MEAYSQVQCGELFGMSELIHSWSNTGIGNLDFIVSALRWQKSMQNLYSPSFFFNNRTGEENELWLGRIRP
jgi:hypothetical protein